MTYLKAAGVVWGILYFLLGLAESFAFNSIDFGSSAALLVGLFLLPLPIVIAGVWLPRAAGVALIGIMVLNVTVVAYTAGSHRSFSSSAFFGYALFAAVYDLPHLLFGAGYIFLGLHMKDGGSKGEEPVT